MERPRFASASIPLWTPPPGQGPTCEGWAGSGDEKRAPSTRCCSARGAWRLAKGTGHRLRAEREAAVLHQLASSALPLHVPKLLMNPVTAHGRSGYATTLVPGSSGPDPPEWERVREVYQELLTNLRSQPTTRLHLPEARAWCGGRRFPEVVADELAPRLGDVADVALQVVTRLVELPETAPCFVHGDFGPHNLLWDDDRAVSMIDFDHAAIADPSIDVASLVSFHGADRVGQIVDADLLWRALVHRATLPLQVAAAAHLASLDNLRNHALSNFRRRLAAGTLFDPDGNRPCMRTQPPRMT